MRNKASKQHVIKVQHLIYHKTASGHTIIGSQCKDAYQN